MRIFELNGAVALDPTPYSADKVQRNSKYKLHCKRYTEAITNDGMMVMRPINDADTFEKLVDSFESVADRLGCDLSVDPALMARFSAVREYAEERYRMGNELKRADDKYRDKLSEFSQVVNDAMVRPLKDRQMLDAFYMASMARVGNFSVPGSGKTATVLGAFAFLAARNKASRLMVVCPKNAFDSWRTEWQACFGDKWPLDCFSTQDSAYHKLGRSDRIRFIRSRIGGKNLLLINYEAAISIAQELKQVACESTLLVFDEVHRVKRVGGKQATAALTIASEAPYTFALTGTPLPNTYSDLYNFLHILYPHEYDSFFGYEVKELKKASEEEQLEINGRIQPFFCRTTKTSLGVPPANPDNLIDLNADSDTAFLLNVLKNRYRKNMLTLMLRTIQMENDPRDLLIDLNPDEYRWILEEDEETGEVDVVDYSQRIIGMIASAPEAPKQLRCIDLVCDLVANGRPVIVWCIFVKSMNDLNRRLHERGIDSQVIYGETNVDNRSKLLDEFRSGAFKVLITNPHTLAESVSLHSICHDAVYYEYSFNLVHLLQSKDRIHRLGLPADQETRYYYLREHYDLGSSQWSMDERIYDRLKLKEETMLRAIEAELIETQPTTEEDLQAIFGDLFERD